MTGRFCRFAALMLLCMGGVFASPSAVSASTSHKPWSLIAPMPGPRNHLAVVSDHNALYVLGGDLTPTGCAFSCNVTNTVLRYSPHSDAWSAEAPMIMARDWLSAVTTNNGMVYALGGYSPDCNCATNTVESYSPSTNKWQLVAPMPVPVLMGAATVGANGEIYLLGGGPSYNDPTFNVLIYNPRSNSWRFGTPMLQPEFVLGAATGPDGLIYAISGSTTQSQVFDPRTKTWSLLPPTPGGSRGYLASASHGSQIFALGGCQCPSINAVDVYSQARHSWSLGPSMIVPRSAFGAAVLGDDLYAIGGDIGEPFGPHPTVYSSGERLHLQGNY
jgi:hypothetical protein